MPHISSKKISPIRLADIKGPRRQKPPVQQVRRALRNRIKTEDALLEMLLKEAENRRFWLEDAGGRPAGFRAASDPFLVFTENNHPYNATDLHPKDLPRWRKLTEAAKFHAGWIVAREFGGYAFTSHIDRQLAQQIAAGGTRSFHECLYKKLRRKMDQQGLQHLCIAYIIEARTRFGRSRTDPHVHGYLIPERLRDVTALKVALEQAWLQKGLRKGRRQQSIKIEPGYDHMNALRGRLQWPSYALKNYDRYDLRLKGRRVYFSRPMTQATREFWSLVRQEPL